MINKLNSPLESLKERAYLLRELTYAYVELWEWNNFNETLFQHYLQSDRDYLWELKKSSNYNWKQEILSDMKKELQRVLDRDIVFLEEEWWDEDTLMFALKFTKEALDFELEKAGYQHDLSDDEIHKKTQKLFELDEIIFWEHVVKNCIFLQQIYSYLGYLIENFSHEMSSEERTSLRWALGIMKRQICEISNESEADNIPKFVPEEPSQAFLKLKDIQISRSDYIFLFDTFFSISGVPQRSQLWNFWSFTDADDFYGVPQNDSYSIKSLYELLQLAPHETWHYVNLQVTLERQDTKHRGDMIKEEWLAKFTEKLIAWIPVENMNATTFAAPSVVCARLMSWADFKQFQNAYGTLLQKAWVHSQKRDLTKEFLRKKRWFSRDFLGWSNKDASYSLGLFSVLEYIKWGGNIENLFWGKISMSDVSSWEFIPHEFGNKYIYHILLAELICFYISHRSDIKASSNHFHASFVSYLRSKYKDLSGSFALFNEAEIFSVKNRMKVMRILKIIKKKSEKE